MEELPYFAKQQKHRSSTFFITIIILLIRPKFQPFRCKLSKQNDKQLKIELD